MWAESLLCPSHGNRCCDAKRFHQQTIIWNSTLFFLLLGEHLKASAGAGVVLYCHLPPSSWGTTASGCWVSSTLNSIPGDVPARWEHWCNINPTLIHPEPRQSLHLLKQHQFLVANSLHLILCATNINWVYINLGQSCVKNNCGEFLDRHNMMLKGMLLLNRY